MEFISWMYCNYQWMTEVLLSLVIAYHVHFLSKKLTAKDRLEHKERIKEKADELIRKIVGEKLRRKVYLVNVNRYFKDYPSNGEKVSGYSTIAAEVKTTRFDGVEFFCSLARGVYRREDGKLTFCEAPGRVKQFSAFPVGVVPYEWIEFVDLDGDEFDYRPLFFARFKGAVYWRGWRRYLPFGYPYKKLVYYRINENFREGSDPHDLEWLKIDEAIYEK